jgi:hypothetical protein
MVMGQEGSIADGTQSVALTGRVYVMADASKKAIKNPELKSRIEKMGFMVEYKSPADMKKMVAEEYEKALAVANKVGLSKKIETHRAKESE